MEKQSDVTTVLIKARAKIARGWCKGGYRDGGDGFCIAGAIYDSADAGWTDAGGSPVPEDMENETAYFALCYVDMAIQGDSRLYDSAEIDDIVNDIAKWQDGFMTSHVPLAAMDRAIDRARADGA